MRVNTHGIFKNGSGGKRRKVGRGEGGGINAKRQKKGETEGEKVKIGGDCGG